MNQCFKAVLVILSLPFFLKGQVNKFEFKPEIGISNPLGDFKSNNVFAKTGLDLGLHIDKMWNRLGIGLYAGFDNNEIDYLCLVQWIIQKQV